MNKPTLAHKSTHKVATAHILHIHSKATPAHISTPTNIKACTSIYTFAPTHIKATHKSAHLHLHTFCILHIH